MTDVIELRAAILQWLPRIASQVGVVPGLYMMPETTTHVALQRCGALIRAAHPEVGIVEYTPWEQLPVGTQVAEASAQLPDGTTLSRFVTTTPRRRWVLTCSCGRLRVTSGNNLERVTRCRICAALARRAQQTEWQRAKRQLQATDD